MQFLLLLQPPRLLAGSLYLQKAMPIFINQMKLELVHQAKQMCFGVEHQVSLRVVEYHYREGQTMAMLYENIWHDQNQLVNFSVS